MTTIAGILVALCALVGAYTSGNYFGHQHGVNDQKVVDQKQFDAISNQLTAQTIEANVKLRELTATIIAAQTASDQFKTNLEQERAQNRNTVDSLRAKYANDSLRFTAQRDPGRGGGSGGASPAKDPAPGAPATTILQLPDAITASLRRLTADADSLATDYRTCYRYVNQ